MKALKICRAALTILLIALALAAAALVLTGLGQGFSYAQARQGAGYLLPLLAAVMLLAAAAAILHRRFFRNEKEKITRAQPYCDREMPARGKNMLRIVLLCVAVILILLGITNGGLWDVLVKAINICTECIGLG